MSRQLVRWSFVFSAAILLLLGVGLIYWFVRSNRAPDSLPGLDTSAVTGAAIPRHVTELKNEDAAVRQKAAWSLWQTGPAAREATPALAEAVGDPDPEVRAMAAKALGQVSAGTPDAVPTLTRAVQDKDPGVRAAASKSLAEIWKADTGARRPPRRQHDEEDEEREKRGRGRKTSPRAEKDREEEEAPARDKDKGRDKPAQAGPILHLSPQAEPLARIAVPVLKEALWDSNASVRAAAAEALAETGPLAEVAVAELIHVLQQDPDADARLQAAIALGNTGPGAKAAVPVLVKTLRKEEFPVRVNSATALAKIRTDPELAVPALVEAYLKDKADVVVWSTIALDRYGSDAARIGLPLIQQAIKDPKNQQDKELQERATTALENFQRKLKEAKAPAPVKPAGKN
jgi:HEAT repeat protein